MLADVLLRISWAINILLAQMKDSAAAATASAVLAPLEVLRLDLPVIGVSRIYFRINFFFCPFCYPLMQFLRMHFESGTIAF